MGSGKLPRQVEPAGLDGPFSFVPFFSREQKLSSTSNQPILQLFNIQCGDRSHVPHPKQAYLSGVQLVGAFASTSPGICGSTTNRPPRLLNLIYLQKLQKVL